jgi:hypothetical protein
VIVLDLVCGEGHRFEGWFTSVDAFNDQVRRQLVSCPQCESLAVERLPAAPHLARGRAAMSERSIDVGAATLMDQLRAIAEASEDVDDRFPEEARRIHYHEVQSRPIRGRATLDEAKELIEEGIPILPVPPKIKPS